MTNSLIKKGSRDRSKIDTYAARLWQKHLRVSNKQLAGAIEKVGNSAAAVRKQLGNNARDDDS